MAAGVQAALDNLTAALVAADIRAALNPEKVNPPAVWVTLSELRPELLNGDGTVAAYLYLIAAGTSHSASLAQLDALLGDVLAVVDPEDVILPVSVVLPSAQGKRTLPSLRITTLTTYTLTP